MKFHRELWLDGLGLIVLAGYILWTLPTIPEKHQPFAWVLAAVVTLTGVLTLIGFRWSPEMVAIVCTLTGGWGAYRLAFDGYTHGRLALIVLMIGGICYTYPELRRVIREPETSN